MKLTSVILLASLAFFNIQCSKSSGGATKVEKFFVKGDPLTVVEGTKMKMDLTISDLKSLENYHLRSLALYEQKAEVETDEQTLKDQQGKSQDETEESEKEGFYSKFVLTESEVNGQKVYTFGDRNIGLELNFVEEKGVLKVFSVQIGNENSRVHSRVQHFSITPDKESFSILVYDNKNESDKTLAAFYFSKQAQYDVLTLDADYDFLAGKGKMLRWEKDSKVTLNICSKSLAHLENRFSQLLFKWTQHIGTADFDVKVLNNPPPFSDLNTQCVYLVQNYIASSSANYANPAAVIPYGTNKMTDADMYLFKEDMDSVNMGLGEFMDSKTGSVVLHEMGHFLGIGHPENLFRPKNKTVMSYNPSHASEHLHAHDVESIKFLYQ